MAWNERPRRGRPGGDARGAGSAGATSSKAAWPSVPAAQRRRRGLSSPAGASIERALAIDAAQQPPTLSDIEHVVILMQENRSFDHYFGTLSGVGGFSDPRRRNKSAASATRCWTSSATSPASASTRRATCSRSTS